MTDPPLPAIVRAAITADGRSIRQIAIAAGLEPMTVGRYASGERDLTSERLGRLMGALGLRVVLADDHLAHARKMVTSSPARAVQPIAP
jgi:transcriptional regulator with XRE-family HTH domain